MPDTPALSSRWLNDEEVRYLAVQAAMRDGYNVESEDPDKFKWSYLKDLFLDYKIYLQAWIYFTASTCVYGLKFTMPTITKSMGYTSSQAQLLTIPPYVAGAISAVIFSRLADHFQWRMPFIFGPMTSVLLGFCILLPLADNIGNRIAACYIGVVLICIGQYPISPASSAWVSSNLAGDSKRAMGIALNICLGNTGGILGSYMFLDSEESKGYPTGFGIGIAFAGLSLIVSLVLEWSYWRTNKQRDTMDEDDVRAKYTGEQLARLGDKNPLYRYKL